MNSFFVLGPIVAGLIALRLRDAERSQNFGVAVSLAFTLGALLLLGQRVFFPHLVQSDDIELFMGAHWHLRADGLATPFLFLAGVVTVTGLLAAPRRSVNRKVVASLLLSLGCLNGLYLSQDLLLLSVFWTASMLMGAIGLPKGEAPRQGGAISIRQAYGWLIAACTIPLLAGTLLIAQIRSAGGDPEPYDLFHANLHPVDSPAGAWALGLMLVVVFVRSGVFPFHSWFPVMFERGGLSAALRLLGSQFGAFLSIRALIPLFSRYEGEELAWIPYAALASAVYASVVGLSQNNLRRALGWVFLAQVDLVLVGLWPINNHGLHGALLQMLALGTSSIGLYLVVLAVESRMGTSDIRHLGGLTKAFPRLSALFLVFSLAVIGIPGGLGFVAEDLLLHDLLTHSPAISLMFLLATLFNGLTLLRLYSLGFMGPSREPRRLGPAVRDLVSREVWVFAGLIAALAIGGFVPNPLVGVQDPVVRALCDQADSSHISQRETKSGTLAHAEVTHLPRCRD